MTTHPYRVTVVDDHSLFAETLVIALRAEGFLVQCVVPTDDLSAGRLVRAIEHTRPDLVLLDLDLGSGGDGRSYISTLTGHGATVVILTGSADRAGRGEALSLGAATVISKSVPFAEILRIVGRLRDGFPVISREERAELVGAWQTVRAMERDVRRRFDQITPREAEVLNELMAGHQVSEIAKKRFVSESTVRTQVKSILAKLQVTSQLTAVGLAHRIGWTPPLAEERATRRRAQQAHRRVGDAHGRQPTPGVAVG